MAGSDILILGVLVAVGVVGYVIYSTIQTLNPTTWTWPSLNQQQAQPRPPYLGR